MENKLWLVEAYGAFGKYEVYQIIVLAPGAKEARDIARKECGWQNRILIASEICMCTPKPISVAYTYEICEICPDDGFGF